MKFEQVIHIYWQKGFLYCGKTIPFHTSWRYLCNDVGGLGLKTKIKLLKRFELYSLFYNNRASFINLDDEVKMSINIILSKITSLNFQLTEIHKLNLIRLYLIKTYRGKAQAMGKPSRGQRTWSNAWTAYNYNKILRLWVATIQKTFDKAKKDEKINFKVVKKTLKKSSKEGFIKQPKKKKSNWF